MAKMSELHYRILELIEKGCTNQQIMDKTGEDEDTVNHLRSILVVS